MESAPAPEPNQGGHGSGDIEALLFATARAKDGGPAALLGVLDTTLVGRLLGQLERLGIRRTWLVTRPEWQAAMNAETPTSGTEVTVVTADSFEEDLAQAAEVARRGGGALLVGHAHLLAHGEALAGLVADRRMASGALVRYPSAHDGQFFPVRGSARITSAGSDFHRVERASGSFLGLVKVDAPDRSTLGAVAAELAGLAADPPEAWKEELARRAESGRPEREPDAPALLLVGLVRRGVRVFARGLRDFFLAAPDSARSAVAAAAELSRRDEERALLASAVKATDSPFTTFFVSPYSKHIVRFAARHGWKPNAVSLVAFAVGLGAATSFAIGSRTGLVVGAVLLQASFMLDCVDGQLARYTRTSTSFGGWLDLILDRTKEYVVYGGLAIGATRGFDDDVWLLAASALALLTVRHLADVAWVAGRERGSPPPEIPLDRPADLPPVRRRGTTERWPSWVRRANEVMRLPIGERFALISLTAAVSSPRVTFVALLVWGATAALYAQSVRVVLATVGGSRILKTPAR